MQFEGSNMGEMNRPHEVIASALALPAEQRLEVLDAIHASLIDNDVDHGGEEPAAEVSALWEDEIARRVEEIQSGSVQTIPAEQAERMIRGDAPSV